MGFSAQWLALREPADRAARDRTIMRAAVHAAGPEPLILDLGCGTGATWRALAPHLPEGTRWRLVDNDPELLRVAAEQIGPGADTSLTDLSDLTTLPLDGVTLVTASALLDLVSTPWLDALARRLAVPFYAALSYDGQMHWTPGDPRDATITAAFNRHQQQDKGLGPALGPNAGPTATTVFQTAGFAVQQAMSPWMLGPDMAELQQELTDGIAQAAGEAGAAGAAQWGQMRHAQASRTQCRIGHVDLLAMPAAKGEPDAG